MQTAWKVSILLFFLAPLSTLAKHEIEHGKAAAAAVKSAAHASSHVQELSDLLGSKGVEYVANELASLRELQKRELSDASGSGATNDLFDAAPEAMRFQTGSSELGGGDNGIKVKIGAGGIKLGMGGGLKAAAQKLMGGAPGMQQQGRAPVTMVPFGKHVERKPGTEYILATGSQECQVCQGIIAEAYLMGPKFADLCSYKDRSGGVNGEMCRAQERVLKSCPEFTNDWCYQDLGGTQALRSPCPAYLKCHYCLGLNPLHCVAQPYGDFHGH